MIDFKAIFDVIRMENTNNQKKIVVNSSLNIFYGKTIDNKLRLSFLSKKKPPVITSTKYIKVYQMAENNEVYWTCFDLEDLCVSSIFYHICDDLLLSISDEANEEEALKKLKDRFDLWKKVLTKKPNNELSINESKGLFGELIFLNNYMMEKYDVNQAINSWVGPEGYSKDFSVESEWYEVKTTGVNSNKIIISSIGQLDSDCEGNLVIVKVEDMSEEYLDGFSTIGELVSCIFNKINDANLRSIFIEKLEKKNISPFVDQDKYHFRFSSLDLYIVNSDFPRIRQSDIAFNEIQDVSYSLIISSLERFKKC